MQISGGGGPTDQQWWGPIALAAARAGSAAILAVLADGTLRREVKTGQHDVVTTADHASERAILAVLRDCRPDDTIVAEESGDHPGSNNFRWLIDPLDGTANFVHGRPDFAVSVGLEHHGVVVAGAVVKPATGQWGVTTGSGLDCDPTGTLQALAPTVPAITLDRALVAVGLPYGLDRRQQVLRQIADLIPVLGGVRVMGSAAADLLAAATGSLDGFLGFGLAPWDTAAGQALVQTAGGVVHRLQIGSDTCLLAGSSTVVEQLLDRLGD